MFQPINQQIPTAIGEIRYTMIDRDGTNPGYGAAVDVLILDQNGRPITVRHIETLIPYLTTAEKNGLVALMVRLRALAVTELLP